MKKINSSQRSYLKGKAHHINPSIFIGKNGLIEGAIHSIITSLESHELIKIKFRDLQVDKKEISIHIASQTDSIIVGIIGHTLILFKQN